MLLVDYKLQDFIEGFSVKMREDEKVATKKFKQVKLELLEHLKQFNADLKSLPDLRIYVILDKNINIEYTETTGVPMTLNLVWKINDIKEEEVVKIVEKLSEELECSMPNSVLISDNHMDNVLAVYYENTKKIIVNKNMLLSYTGGEIESILKHELIHHKLSEAGLNAEDTSDEFIEEVIKNDAFVSGEPEAQKAYKKKIKNKKKR